MKPYHRIMTVLKRDPATNHKTLLKEFATPEFEYLRGNSWAFTEKVDGTNIRIMSSPDGDVSFGGRTDNAQLPFPLVDRLHELFPSHGKLHEQFPGGGCLYGEGYGAKIQKGGGNYSSTQEFVLFDVLVRSKCELHLSCTCQDWWLVRDAVQEVARDLKIHVVPFIGLGTLDDMIRIVRDRDLKSAWGDFPAEGIVARPFTELFNRRGARIITKLKARDFR